MINKIEPLGFKALDDAKDDDGAKREAEFYKEHIQLVEDNKANVVSIHEAPFGEIGNLREVK